MFEPPWFACCMSLVEISHFGGLCRFQMFATVTDTATLPLRCPLSASLLLSAVKRCLLRLHMEEGSA